MREVKSLRELTGLTTRLESLNCAVVRFQSALKMSLTARTSPGFVSTMSYSRLVEPLLPLLPPRAERVKLEVMMKAVLPSMIIPIVRKVTLLNSPERCHTSLLSVHPLCSCACLIHHLAFLACGYANHLLSPLFLAMSGVATPVVLSVLVLLDTYHEVSDLLQAPNTVSLHDDAR